MQRPGLPSRRRPNLTLCLQDLIERKRALLKAIIDQELALGTKRNVSQRHRIITHTLNLDIDASHLQDYVENLTLIELARARGQNKPRSAESAVPDQTHIAAQELAKPSPRSRATGPASRPRVDQYATQDGVWSSMCSGCCDWRNMDPYEQWEAGYTSDD